MKKQGTLKALISVAVVALIFFLAWLAEKEQGASSMLVTVLKKGAVYALIAVSMNLLNGFTGLFSLGQAGFMLVGAYTYAVFTIPLAKRAAVYQYYAGGCVGIELNYIVALILGGRCGGDFRGADRSAGAAAEKRLSGHCDAGLCGNHSRHCAMGHAGPGHERLQPAQDLSDLQDGHAGKHSTVLATLSMAGYLTSACTPIC